MSCGDSLDMSPTSPAPKTTGKSLSQHTEYDACLDPDNAYIDENGSLIESLDGLHYAPDREPWERQPDETDADWELFCIYRDLEPGKRSYREVCRNCERPIRQINKTALAERWKDRVARFDRHIDEQLVAELVARRIKARVETADTGQLMRRKAAQAIRRVKAIIYKREAVYDPETGETTNKMVAKSALTPREIVQLANAGVELERLALGETDVAAAQLHQTLIVNQKTQTVNIDQGELIRNAQEIIAAAESRPIEID